MNFPSFFSLKKKTIGPKVYAFLVEWESLRSVRQVAAYTKEEAESVIRKEIRESNNLKSTIPISFSLFSSLEVEDLLTTFGEGKQDLESLKS